MWFPDIEKRNREFNEVLNNRADFRGCTSLHYATLADNYEIIKLLLDAGNLHLLEVEVHPFSHRCYCRFYILVLCRRCVFLRKLVALDLLGFNAVFPFLGADPSIENHQRHKAEHYIKQPVEGDVTSQRFYNDLHKLFRDAEEKVIIDRREKEREERRKFPLDSRLREKIVGQYGAISTVASGKSINRIV